MHSHAVDCYWYSHTSSSLLQEWVDILENDANVWDQNAFNDLFRRGSKPLPDRTDRLFE